jgi:CheY-like chemotaxis protein
MNNRSAVVVDDDRFIRKIVERTLSGDGFKITEAENGEEGLAVIQEVLPQLVVLDIFMPGEFDGVEVCRRLREDDRFHDTVIVVMSSSDRSRESRRSIEAGANIFIPKPFSPKNFLQQVKLLLKDKGGSQ